MKKIIFFDGDGTLWYPKKTKYDEKPWWIYYDNKTKRNYHEHLIPIPGLKQTLKKLKSMGIVLVIVSQSPYTKRIATQKLRKTVEHLGLADYFDEICAAHSIKERNRADPKDRFILEVLKKRRMPKSSAMFVGDTYLYDYLAARRCGIDAILIYSFKHTKGDKMYRRVRRKIENISEVLNYIN
jgi:HAD superfamily phosphatase (TIGR01681 family)